MTLKLKQIDDELPQGVIFTRLNRGVRLEIDGKTSECSRHESEWLNKCEALAHLKLIHKFPEPVCVTDTESPIITKFNRAITDRKREAIRNQGSALSHAVLMVESLKTALDQLA